jgi:RluA family pseudouridine synthase
LYILESHIVKSLQVPIRFEEYCRGLFIQYPSNKSVKKGIKKGSIQLNNEIVEGGRFLNLNDNIQLIELEENPPKPFPLEIEILFEDEDLAIVNKPSGLVTSGNLYRTLENVIQNQIMPSNLKGGLKWPKPCHRLDSATSGMVIISKSIAAHIKLGEMLRDKHISKTYRAIVVGEFPEETKIIDSLISGKKSITKINKLSSSLSLRNEKLSLLELQPITGRTHQLRIHLSELGHPIVGDMEYGEEGKTLEHKGLFLAAVQLTFKHPISKSPINICIPSPNKFNVLLKRETERFLKFSKK